MTLAARVPDRRGRRGRSARCPLRAVDPRVPDERPDPPAGRRWARRTAAMGGENGADLPRGRGASTTSPTGSTRGTLLRDFDYGPPRSAPTGGPCASGRSSRRTGRSRWRPGCGSRRGRSTAGSRARRCAAPQGDLLRVRFVNRSEHPHTMHFHGIHPADMDGVPMVGPRHHRARRGVHLHLRRRAVRAAPLPLPRRPAGRAHRPRHVRHVHHRPARRPAAGRRDGDGAARLQHHLRRAGQPALRGQRHPVRLHARPGPGRAAASWCGSTWSTSWSTTRSTASTCTATSSTTTRPAPGWSRRSSPTPSCRPRASAGSARCGSRTPGRFMFHAHKTEFADLGWMGFFEVVEDGATVSRRRPTSAGHPPRPGVGAWCCVVRRAVIALVLGGAGRVRRRSPAGAGRAAGRGARRRADGARARARSSSRCATPGPIRCRSRRSFVNDTYVDFTGGDEPIGRLGSDDGDAALPVDRRAALHRLDAHLDRAGHRARDPGGGGDARTGRRLLRADDAARASTSGSSRCCWACWSCRCCAAPARGAVRVLLALTVGLLAFLAVDAALEGFDLGRPPPGGVRRARPGAARRRAGVPRR